LTLGVQKEEPFLSQPVNNVLRHLVMSNWPTGPEDVMEVEVTCDDGGVVVREI
jgi:hypothetical protein